MRDYSIDTLRGLACVLLVGYHVVGNTPSSGLGIESGHYRDISEALNYLRMPLFTFLSGMVYASRPFSGDFNKFLRGKARRLLVPMLVVGTVFAVAQTLIPGTNGEYSHWPLIHIFPVAHFWFVESLFIIFVVIAALEHLRLLESVTGVVLCLFFASMLFLSSFNSLYFSLSGAVYLMPFFLGGIAVARFHVGANFLGFRAWALFLITLVLMFWEAYAEHEPATRRSVFSLTVGLLACAALSWSGLNSQLMAMLGRYSYAIYLYHVFFTAGARITLQSVEVSNTHFLFLTCTCAGLLLPIAVENWAKKHPMAKVTLLGQRTARIDLAETSSRGAS